MGNSVVQSFVALVVLLHHGFATESGDYCRNHLFENVADVLQFSKENSQKEIAVLHGPKSLYCCSNGYNSIEWFKDGIPYPWSSDVSTFVVSSGSENQTIHSESIAEIDSGGYWCVVRNCTDSLRHDVFLKVFSSSTLVGPPKPTYQPKSKGVLISEPVRLYCEAFVGGNRSSLNEDSDISWRKVDGKQDNHSIPNTGRVRQEVVSRERGQILGSYLLISDVSNQDFGEYICRINSTGWHFLELNATIYEDKSVHVRNHSYPSKDTILFIILMILSAALSVLSILFFRSHFRIIYNRLFEDSCPKRSKKCDIFVIYHPADKEIALNKIALPLMESYHYTCNLQPVTLGKLSAKDLNEKSSYSKRMIVLLSPALTENEWTCQKVNLVLNKISGVHPRTIAVLLEPLPINDTPYLKELLQRIYCIEYDRSMTDKFWELLTLGLPNRDFVAGDCRENEELV